ncbi:2-dehydro-3-deoxygalactonokinase [Undibacterium sp.]|jgi:2-dehydro-3-deoxygalactonokinase|uniref:2-dehydro-3-deoxygalactonokinase n=1 Tax=Undibacterium sp. TaxID=1914977 RepID=UPI002CAC5CC8|nr:2-dehydro-3-deoxygalactonokinase [Undibacterium sp.]HTD02664.1 2-dehydro-3-deoxygalactonokinase [Undibacterium sp.]
MTYILTIDTGTTNTRVTLWHEGAVIAHQAHEVGVRDTAISGNREKLQKGVRETILKTLHAADISEPQVTLVLGSGMISSNVGLFELPHVLAPAGLQQLARGMVSVNIPEVFSKPIWFVPGVRNVVDNIGLHNCEAMDMMRGEEVEVVGVIDQLALTGPAMMVMPGSHSKFVCIDDKNRITGCVTTLAGELMYVITHNTILAQSLESSFATSINPEMLLAGAQSAQTIGLGRTCFNVRILDQFTIYERNDRANFLLGAILGADLLTLKNSTAIKMMPGTPVVICGKPVMKEALALLIQNDDYFSGKVTIVSDEMQTHLAGLGAIRVATARGLIK